jgi:hypothetical protein
MRGLGDEGKPRDTVAACSPRRLLLLLVFFALGVEVDAHLALVVACAASPNLAVILPSSSLERLDRRWLR